MKLIIILWKGINVRALKLVLKELFYLANVPNVYIMIKYYKKWIRNIFVLMNGKKKMMNSITIKKIAILLMNIFNAMNVIMAHII